MGAPIRGGKASCWESDHCAASHPAAMTHLSVPPERKAMLGITDNLVRISVGIEDADDLIADFEQALAAV